MTLSCGSLFSGLGSFDLAFERAGFRVAWQCEIDPAARRVLAHHWPDVPCYGDITEVNPADLEPVDVVVFGSPCQDLSVAGKRAGLEGERSGLFYQAARVIRWLRPAPALVVWENVAGALSSNHGLDFAAVLDTLAECGALDICWRLLDGQYAGVAQRRRRVWVVADFGGQRAGQVLLEPESLRGHPAAGREAREGVACTIGVGSKGSGPHNDDTAGAWVADGVAYPSSGRGEVAGEGVAFALRSSGGGSPERSDLNLIVGAVSASHGKGPNTTLDDGALIIACECADTLSVGANQTFGFVGEAVAVSLRGRDGGGTAELGGDASPALRASQGGGDKPHVLAFAQNQREEIRDLDGLAVALNAEPGTHQQTFVGSGMLVRRLMPVECLRLMGLPDDWLDGLALADSTKYRLVGNSLIVNEAEWIARRSKAALRGDA